MPHVSAYMCLCGMRQSYTGAVGVRRRWGTLDYAPRFEHICEHCQRYNIVHDGVVVCSLQSGKSVPASSGDQQRS